AASPTIQATSTAPLTVTVNMPARAQKNLLTALTVNLPAKVAAVEGRLLVAKGVADLMGVAPVKGTALRPSSVKGGFSFAAYNLSSVSGHNALQLVVLPHRSGSLQLRVVVDSAADKYGHRLNVSVSATSSAATIGVKAVGQK